MDRGKLTPFSAVGKDAEAVTKTSWCSRGCSELVWESQLIIVEDWSFHLCHKTFGIALIYGVQRELMLWHQQRGVFESRRHFAAEALWTPFTPPPSLPKEAAQKPRANALHTLFHTPKCLRLFVVQNESLLVRPMSDTETVVFLVTFLTGGPGGGIVRLLRTYVTEQPVFFYFLLHEFLNWAVELECISVAPLGSVWPPATPPPPPPSAEQQRCCCSCQMLTAAN